uniref:Fucosyltransferase n=1 Tax=Cicer arietinum TaxID=3827 RepID=A0A3Q7YGF8_CICAR|nr:probable fucosyltransferase 8 [Cicer arietinum]
MVWLGLSSNGIRASLVILVISISLFILTLTSNFGHFELFSKCNNVLNEGPQNVTTKDLTLRAIIPQNITNSDDVGAKNCTESNNAVYFCYLIKIFNMSKSTGSKNSSNPSTKNHGDKFLDGLIPSGFDKKSCLSRFELYLYRKSSPHKPSPYLISKLRSYEDLHRKCGPHTKAYKRTMVKLKKFKSINVTTSGSCKYIIWTHADGLGNRMVSMVSSFLYAILTDRVLLVEFQDDMVDLFCEPFPNSSWLLPKDFPFSNNNRNHIETYQNILEKDRENHSKELPSVIQLKILPTNNNHERFFSCDHSQHLLIKVPILIFLSDQYFVPSLFMVPSFTQELSKMFPNKETVFHHLGRYLFFPTNDVWGPTKRFYQAYLAKADEKIGLQIRVFNPDLTSHQTVLNQVLNCTQKHKILPGFAVENSEDSPEKNERLKSVLVASLYPEYGENLRTMYLNKATVTGEILGVYQPSHEGHQKFGDNLHNKKALTEIYLLSLCDDLVTSALSTFGYVAQSLGGITPRILYKLQGNNVPDSPCVQDVSMEPCFHLPPKHDCMEKPIDDDIGTTFPYMRRCLDYKWGIKLVNDLQ